MLPAWGGRHRFGVAKGSPKNLPGSYRASKRPGTRTRLGLGEVLSSPAPTQTQPRGHEDTGVPAPSPVPCACR